MTTTAELVHCPPSETMALERTRFFPRQLVTPDDLTQDQRYFRDKLRRHNRFLHGWGVVCGAGVRKAAEAGKVVVEPGYVLGPWGDEIVIDREVVVDLSHETTDGLVHATCVDPADPWCTSVRVERRAGATFYLAVRYDECDTRPIRVATDACGCDLTECQYSRTRDGYALKLLTQLPAGYTSRPSTRTPAATEQRCAFFRTPGTQSGNSRTVEGIKFEVSHVSQTVVATVETETGLMFNDQVRVTLPAPASRVTMHVWHADNPLSISEVRSDGTLHELLQRPANRQAEELAVTGSALTVLQLSSKNRPMLEWLCADLPAAPPPPTDDHGACPPCPADPWVILADISFKSSGDIDTLDPDKHRRWVVSQAGRETVGAAPTGGAAGGGTPGGTGGGTISVPPGRRPFDIGHLREMLDRTAVRRWQEEHGSDPGALGELPITALKGIGAGLGRTIGRLRLGGRVPGEMRLRDVADMPRDEFVARVVAAAPAGAARPDVERRAAEAWTRAREITGRG